MGFREVGQLVNGGERLSEADPDFNQKVEQLPQAERVAIRAAQQGAKSSLEDVQKRTGLADARLVAKYKIEILFGPKRTLQGPNATRILVWESGSKLHGGGDASCFFCKDASVENGEGCWAPILPSQVNGPFAFCTYCNRTVNADKLANQMEGFVHTKALVQQVVKLFQQLGSNADLYCKYNADDIHYISMLRQHGSAKAKRLMGLHMYQLQNIVKDTANGADLGKRFFAFFTS